MKFDFLMSKKIRLNSVLLYICTTVPLKMGIGL